jgi:hypothetical protein
MLAVFHMVYPSTKRLTVTRELAGHSSIETPMKYYYQVDEYHRAKAARITAELLKKVDV